uniref:glycogenin glucosyltransferase n=1 Tax=Suberites domuncula TaxID=55567 RepID=M5BC51_SUBDO|nr:glycogenin [Suberites domuncula]
MEAFVSLVTNDSYALGAIALGRSLRNTGTWKKLALLITNQVSQDMRCRLERQWDELVLVEQLDSEDSEHLALLTRPELGVTFSKIHAWRLTQYSKCVFLDADTIVLQNVDELFDREELSAAPDIGWPDCFNSGVFVFEPSLSTFRGLMDLARQRGSFDGGDQGLLNVYWSDWPTKDIKYHLPFIYNVTPNITYGYAPAYERFGHNIKIIHFIGPNKPWQHHYVPEVDSVILFPGTYASEHGAQDYIRRWWQLYIEAEQIGQSDFMEIADAKNRQVESVRARRRSSRINHQTNFEHGHIDFNGRDSFENIQAHIEKMMNSN